MQTNPNANPGKQKSWICALPDGFVNKPVPEQEYFRNIIKSWRKISCEGQMELPEKWPWERPLCWAGLIRETIWRFSCETRKDLNPGCWWFYTRALCSVSIKLILYTADDYKDARKVIEEDSALIHPITGTFKLHAVVPVGSGLIATRECSCYCTDSMTGVTTCACNVWVVHNIMRQNPTLIARFMGPKWGPSGTGRTQMGPILAPWTGEC